MGTVGDYLDSLPADRADALRRVVELVLAEIPDAVEGTSYGMPALLLDGKPLLGVQSASKHLAVYPFSPAAVSAVADRLGPGTWSKGTVRFTPANPLPDDVARDLVRARAAEVRT